MLVKAVKAVGRGTNWTAFAGLIEALLGKHTRMKDEEQMRVSGIETYIFCVIC
jgi:hypothetical protein